MFSNSFITDYIILDEGGDKCSSAPIFIEQGKKSLVVGMPEYLQRRIKISTFKVPDHQIQKLLQTWPQAPGS